MEKEPSQARELMVKEERAEPSYNTDEQGRKNLAKLESQ